jgi:glucokinase
MASKLQALSLEGGLPDTENLPKDPGQLTGRDVVRWALEGNELALRVVIESGEHLGRGIAMLIDTLNPDLVVVGSMGVRLGDLLLEPARRVIQEEAIASSVRACSIVPAALGESIGDYAALCVALEHQNQGETNGNRDSYV